MRIGLAILFLQMITACGNNRQGNHSKFAEHFNESCASRLQNFHNGPAACLVIRHNQALLVKVPYGESPGWDFPGGHSKEDEFSCETAERETCEESRFKVRATRSISNDLFLCEIDYSQTCHSPVDEGFLETRWIHSQEIDAITYREGTWGDKPGYLRQFLNW